MLLLFDIDGVINRSEYFTIKYCKEFKVDLNVFESFFKNEFNLALLGKEDLTKLLPIHFEQWKWNENVEEFLTYWFTHDIELDIELLDILQQLKKMGYKLGIASQQDRYRKEYLLKLPQLIEIFQEFYFSCDIGYLKTDSKFYTSISSKYKELHFWDDTLEVIEVAKKSGINTYLYTDISNFKKQITNITGREF